MKLALKKPHLFGRGGGEQADDDSLEEVDVLEASESWSDP